MWLFANSNEDENFVHQECKGVRVAFHVRLEFTHTHTSRGWWWRLSRDGDTLFEPRDWKHNTFNGTQTVRRPRKRSMKMSLLLLHHAPHLVVMMSLMNGMLLACNRQVNQRLQETAVPLVHHACRHQLMVVPSMHRLRKMTFYKSFMFFELLELDSS
jgi:hypothetical protein